MAEAASNWQTATAVRQRIFRGPFWSLPSKLPNNLDALLRVRTLLSKTANTIGTHVSELTS